MDGWNTIVSFWGPAYFQLRTVSFRECAQGKLGFEVAAELLETATWASILVVAGWVDSCETWFWLGCELEGFHSSISCADLI